MADFSSQKGQEDQEGAPGSPQADRDRKTPETGDHHDLPSERDRLMDQIRDEEKERERRREKRRRRRRRAAERAKMEKEGGREPKPVEEKTPEPEETEENPKKPRRRRRRRKKEEVMATPFEEDVTARHPRETVEPFVAPEFPEGALKEAPEEEKTLAEEEEALAEEEEALAEEEEAPEGETLHEEAPEEEELPQPEEEEFPAFEEAPERADEEIPATGEISETDEIFPEGVPPHPMPHYESARTIPEDSEIELASRDELTDLPPVSMEKAQEEEKVIAEEIPSAYTEGPPEVIPAGEEKLEVAKGGVTAEVYDREIPEQPEETPEQVRKEIDAQKPELKLEESLLAEKGSVFDALRTVMAEISPILKKVFNFRMLGSLVLFIGLAWGGFWVYSQNFFGIFGNGEAALGPEGASDPAIMREYGLSTNVLFGDNRGSQQDQVPVSVQIADFFGTLSEPALQGETGISAATYYGALLDEREIINQFVEYVRDLASLQNLYSIDVYAMLDRTTRRDQALFDYIAQMREAHEEGERNLQAVLVNIDDLKVSYNSIADDKTAFETDFFDALQQLEAEKSDLLLKSFIDVSQKQIALRARLAALEKVVAYYETTLAKLQRRIDAVDSNRDALIQGIRVVEVPGASELDIIIRP